MSMMEQRVTAVCREVFGDPDLVLSEATTAADIEGWDSFNHINLVMQLEEEFSISFSTKEIGAMTCVGDLFRLIDRKTARV